MQKKFCSQDPEPEYTVTLSEAENGRIFFDDTDETSRGYGAGEKVTVNLQADDGYGFSSITLTTTEDGETAGVGEGSGEESETFEFDMPEADITVSAEFAALPAPEYLQADDVDTDAVLEEYVFENADEGFTEGTGDPTVINGMIVKNTIMDANYLEAGDTIDSVMGAIESGNEEAAMKVLGQIESTVAVYDVNPDSDYYVASANTMMDTADVWDYIFALYDVDGNVVDGCYYDAATGLAYIPKDLYIDEDGNFVIGRIQLQLMQVVGGQTSEAESDVSSSVFDKEEGVADVYESSDEIFALETTAYVEAGLNEDEMVVSVNGIPTDEYDYDPATGEITIDQSSAAIQTLSVSSDVDDGIMALSAGIQTLVTKDEMVTTHDGETVITLPGWWNEGDIVTGKVSFAVLSDSAATDDIYAYITGIYDDDAQKLYDWIEGEIDSIDTSNLIVQKSELNFILNFRASDSTGVTGIFTDANGNEVDLSSIGRLYTACGHVSSPYGSGEEDFNTHTSKSAVRLLWINDDGTQGVFGIIGGYNEAPLDTGGYQAAMGLYKFNITRGGYVTLQKSSANTSITDGNGCYDLAGAQYTVYTDSGCSTVAKDIDGNNAILTTKSDGTTNTLTMDQGTYYVKETKAATGYELDTTVYEVTVTSENTEDNPAVVKCSDVPLNDPAGITLYKVDSETGEKAQGDASLAGAQFTVKYYDGYYDESSLPSSATRTWVLETKDAGGYCLTGLFDEYKVSGDDFYYEDGRATLPLGTISIQETQAPEGYIADDTLYVSQITGNGNTASLQIGNEKTVTDEVIRGGVKVQKRDSESLRDEAQGSGSFAGITMTITNDSENAVIVEGVSYEPGEVVKTLVTDDDGYAGTADDLLPYGTYTIAEVDSIPTADGYLYGSEDHSSVSSTTSIQFEIRTDGEIVDLTGTDSSVTDLVKRGDIALTKHNAETQESMSVPFEITSRTTGESHIFWTDENGDYSSDSTWNKHTYNTDAGETPEDGLWFYGYADEEASGVAVDNNLGALPYDSYNLDELPCEANEGMELVHTTFTVSRDVRVIDLGQFYNAQEVKATPYMHSQAWAGDTGTQLCYAGDQWVTLYDDVWYYNLDPDTTYYLYGIAYDVDSGEPEVDHYGDVISATTEFTTDDTGDGMLTQEFYFDVEDLAGHRATFYEAVYYLDEDGEDYIEGVGNVTFVMAEDPDDYPQQTIYFPQVGTTLTDEETGTHYSVADDKVTLVDTVIVTEVPEGEKVTVRGTLMSKNTGEAVTDADGSPVTAEKTFVSTGVYEQEVELEFTFDASALDGDAVVAFEDLYQVLDDDMEVLVGRHADIDDEGQTVAFPGIHTEALDSKTGTHTANAAEDTVIIDHVDYSGLTAGEEYTIEGVLMDQSTGEKLVDSAGNNITAEVTFTAESEDGTVDLEFPVDTSDLAGTTIVVFEDLYYKGELVATHSDIDDVAQSVYVPEIGTTATDAADGDKTVASGLVTVNDEVQYSGLEPGRTYTMVGTLMDKSTGEAVTENGEAVTAQTEFVPDEADGSVTLPIEVDTSSLSGADLVVYETVYERNDDDVDVEVASHKDINDEGQTVSVETPEATPEESPTVKTGETPTGLIIGIIGCCAVAAIIIAVAVTRRKKKAAN